MKNLFILLPNNLLDYLIAYVDNHSLINLFSFPKSAKIMLFFPKRKAETPSPKIVFWPCRFYLLDYKMLMILQIIKSENIHSEVLISSASKKFFDRGLGACPLPWKMGKF